jgi:hypothetical protein
LLIKVQLKAQSISIISNIKAISNETITSKDSTNLAFQGETSLSLNLRFFTSGMWAVRLGIGLDNLKYQIDKDVSTSYDFKRKDVIGYLGFEKHFDLLGINPYLGIAVPIKFNTNDILGTSQKSFQNGSVRLGMMVITGISLEVANVLRIGAEFNMGYDKFKGELLSTKEFDLNRIDYNTEFTFGVAF